MLKRDVFVVLILVPAIFICLTNICYCGDEGDFVPWDYNNQKLEEKVNRQNNDVSPMAYLLIQGIKFFQVYISPVDGDRCPMIPTCSTYAIQAVRKHGFFIGTMMTVDRLMHEGDEIQYAPAVIQGDRERFDDPVSNNDFWFYKNEGNEKYSP